MEFDRWFDEQSLLVKVFLLFIPFIGWIVEVLVRVSALIKNKSNMNIAGLVIFAILGEFWIFCIFDAIYLVINDHLSFLE